MTYYIQMKKILLWWTVDDFVKSPRLADDFVKSPRLEQ